MCHSHVSSTWGLAQRCLLGVPNQPCPLSCTHKLLYDDSGTAASTPSWGGEEGVHSSLQGARPQEEEGCLCPGEAAALLASPGLHPLQGEAGTETVLGKEGLETQHSATPPPFRAGCPSHTVLLWDPAGRAGNGARLGGNEKQLQEVGAGYLGGPRPANKTIAA